MAIDTESEVKLIRYAAEVLAQAQNVVAFTGQGISPIPDALQEWIDLEQFLADPPKVWQEYNRQRQLLKSTPPTVAHDALAEMEFLLEKFFLITQNTDGLHQAACSTQLVEIHGNRRQARCIYCDYQTEESDLGDEPRCPLCGNWLRPAVVWPDEPLPEEEFSIACEACELADLLLSIGNQAEVQPSASMIWQAKATGATLIEICPDLTAASHLADIRLAASPAKALPSLVFALKELLPSFPPALP
jgi:NAD-dependent deacetylase